MTEHSPLPWQIATDRSWVILDEQGATVVARMATGFYAPNDARMIVRAVNSHDRLLAAAKQAVLAYERNDIPGHYASVATLRAAIAAVEEKAP